MPHPSIHVHPSIQTMPPVGVWVHPVSGPLPPSTTPHPATSTPVRPIPHLHRPQPRCPDHAHTCTVHVHQSGLCLTPIHNHPDQTHAHLTILATVQDPCPHPTPSGPAPCTIHSHTHPDPSTATPIGPVPSHPGPVATSSTPVQDCADTHPVHSHASRTHAFDPVHPLPRPHPSDPHPPYHSHITRRSQTSAHPQTCHIHAHQPSIHSRPVPTPLTTPMSTPDRPIHNHPHQPPCAIPSHGHHPGPCHQMIDTPHPSTPVGPVPLPSTPTPIG
ncbi:pollen-specific leucine-rich repeat extensin-like protein 3 [Haliotis rubra]|uniref:pollen-specific leucine-rich repeat extensin-like protein 3 n=1 Tax=Haliotis rubra TaxID=36100 RepID=UPI001EE63129|nr:pollen-specific leucine-rich repeat extensin-like protein 3 [Haliotis rubra]